MAQNCITKNDNTVKMCKYDIASQYGLFWKLQIEYINPNNFNINDFELTIILSEFSSFVSCRRLVSWVKYFWFSSSRWLTVSLGSRQEFSGVRKQSHLVRYLKHKPWSTTCHALRAGTWAGVGSKRAEDGTRPTETMTFLCCGCVWCSVPIRAYLFLLYCWHSTVMKFSIRNYIKANYR